MVGWVWCIVGGVWWVLGGVWCMVCGVWFMVGGEEDGVFDGKWVMYGGWRGGWSV